MADQQYEGGARFDTAIEQLPDHLDCYLGEQPVTIKQGIATEPSPLPDRRSNDSPWLPKPQLLGLMLHQMGKNEEALVHLQRAMDLNPEYPEAPVSSGSVLVALGRGDEAVGCLPELASNRSSLCRGWNNLGGIHCQQGTPERPLNASRRHCRRTESVRSP